MTSDFVKPDWKVFGLTLWAVALGTALALYLFIILVDPYDNLPVSPDLPRIQVSGTDRQYKPSLARRPEYRGVLLGASTSMLLNPLRLGQAFDVPFANMAMPAASPYEQLRLLWLYHDHHPSPEFVLFGLDWFWCFKDGAPKQMGANVGQPTWDWLYDDTRWNNWPGLNSQSLKHARRQLRAMLDPGQSPAARHGYYDFTAKDYGPYKLRGARQKIYGRANDLPKPSNVPRLMVEAVERQAWDFPDLDRLRESFQQLPDKTLKLVFFTPIHWYTQAHTGTRKYEEQLECKRRVAALGNGLRNYLALDFMYHSPITLDDRYFWDKTHFTTEIANQVVDLLKLAVYEGAEDPGGRFRYLARQN